MQYNESDRWGQVPGNDYGREPHLGDEAVKFAHWEGRLTAKLLGIELPDQKKRGYSKEQEVETENFTYYIAEGDTSKSRVFTIRQKGSTGSISLLHITDSIETDLVKGSAHNYPERYPHLFGVTTSTILMFLLDSKDKKNEVSETNPLSEQENNLESVSFYFDREGNSSKAYAYEGREHGNEDIRGSISENASHTIVKRDVSIKDFEIVGMALKKLEHAFDEFFKHTQAVEADVK